VVLQVQEVHQVHLVLQVLAVPQEVVVLQVQEVLQDLQVHPEQREMELYLLPLLIKMVLEIKH